MDRDVHIRLLHMPSLVQEHQWPAAAQCITPKLNTGGPRTLTITAGCETFVVNQNGVQVTNPVPVITSLAPTGTPAGSGAVTLTVN